MFLVEASATLPFSPDAVFAIAGSIEATLWWQTGVLGMRRLGRSPDGALRLTMTADAGAPPGVAPPPPDAASLRRLLGRRAPRDLVRLDTLVTQRARRADVVRGDAPRAIPW